MGTLRNGLHLKDVLPGQVGLSHGGHSDCTAPGSASENYPERGKNGHQKHGWTTLSTCA